MRSDLTSLWRVSVVAIFVLSTMTVPTFAQELNTTLPSAITPPSVDENGVNVTSGASVSLTPLAWGRKAADLSIA